MAYDALDNKPTFKLHVNRDGYTVTRELQVYADTEGDVLSHADMPAFGSSMSIGSVTLWLGDIDISEASVAAGYADDGTGPDQYLYDVVLTWSSVRANAPEVDKATWRIDGRNERVRVFSVDKDTDQVHYSGSGSGLSDPYEGTGINVSNDGPQGVDVDDPYEVLVIEFWKSVDDVEDFLDVLRDLHDHVNDAAFEGPWGTYDEGQARVYSYSVSEISNQLLSVSVEFLARKNNDGASGSGLPLRDIWLDGPQETVEVSKDGHQYLWVRQERWTDKTDDTKTRMATLDAHVATLYKSADFSQLGVNSGIWT